MENKKYRVFIVEDNNTESMVFKLAFSGLKNIETKYFRDGQSLLDDLSSNPDIIIVDLMLPDIHGLELIKKIKAFDSTIEMMVVSAQDDFEMVAKVQDQGIFNYIVKSESCLLYIKRTLENLILLLEARDLKKLST